MVSKANLSDHELLLLIKKADYPAFTEIYNRYWEKMASYAVKITKSEDEAADIVQEIFVSFWNRRAVIEVKGTLVAYLIRSTRNLSLRYIERNIHKTDFIENLVEFAVDHSQNIEENISFKELQNYVDQSISKLPVKMQEVYLLSRDEQLSYKEIAQRLGISEGTVKKQISNALKIISGALNGKLSAVSYGLFFILLK